MTYRVTPQLGRMRVNEHCSFFWAERDGLRVVEKHPEHCNACINELLQTLANEGVRVELFEASANASRILRAVEHDKPSGHS